MSHWRSIVQHIEQATGEAFSVKQQRSLGGGSINNAFLLTGDNKRYFVKTNRSGAGTMFAAEARGLRELASSHTVKVPEPVCYGDDLAHSYIVLEYLDMAGRANQAH